MTMQTDSTMTDCPQAHTPCVALPWGDLRFEQLMCMAYDGDEISMHWLWVEFQVDFLGVRS